VTHTHAYSNKKAVLSQGNSTMQRVLPTLKSNDTSIVTRIKHMKLQN